VNRTKMRISDDRERNRRGERFRRRALDQGYRLDP
jgi:hypothetical protein